MYLYAHETREKNENLKIFIFFFVSFVCFVGKSPKFY
jgi:hypothetical protein